MLKQAGYGDWAMDVVHKVATDFATWNHDPKVLQAARIELGEKLSEINSNAPSHTITATSDKHGTISPEGIITISNGQNQEFTFTPDEGYHVDKVKIDGKYIPVVKSYKFENVTENHTIEVKFKANDE
jgi:hypothetical protein